MIELVRRPRVLSVVAPVAALFFCSVTISSCGGDVDSATSELASWMPADSVVYIVGAIEPEGKLADNVDQTSNKLTGESLGDSLITLLDDSSQSDIDFETDVEPWLGESAALAVTADLSGYSTGNPLEMVSDTGSHDLSGEGKAESTKVKLVVETTDSDAAQSYVDKDAAGHSDSTKGEYEGTAYTVSDSGSTVLGVSDDLLIAADSVAGFESMIDAHGGESLADTDAFSDLADKAADGSLANLFATSAPVIDAVSGSGTTDESGSGADDESGGDTGSGADPVYEALGIDPQNTGVLLSLVPGDDEISLQGVSNVGSEFVNGDPGALIETFPADTVFATGSDGVGANLRKIIDAVDEQGIEGALKPGELQKMIDQASGSGVDLNALIDSLETAGMFVSGNSVDSLGGALVVTSSDLKPLENSLALISTLIGQSGNAQVRPLTGSVTGFSVRTPELPGRPVFVAIKGDRFVVAIGAKAARQALGGGGSTLADSEAYQAAVGSLSGNGIDLFADPPAIGKLIRDAAGRQPEAVKAADVMNKFEYVGGGGSDEDGTFEFNLGLGN